MAAPQFTVNAQRFDPYKNFKFRIKWDGKYVAGMSKVSALKRSTEVVTHREGGDPSTSRLTASVWKFEPITLERGVTHDTDFEDWANAAQKLDKGHASQSLKGLRQDIRIELLNEAGQPVLRYMFYRCWVSEYQPTSDLDAGANAIAIEHIKLENEGWERDLTLTEPTEI